MISLSPASLGTEVKEVVPERMKDVHPSGNLSAALQQQRPRIPDLMLLQSGSFRGERRLRYPKSPFFPRGSRGGIRSSRRGRYRLPEQRSGTLRPRRHRRPGGPFNREEFGLACSGLRRGGCPGSSPAGREQWAPLLSPWFSALLAARLPDHVARDTSSFSFPNRT